MKQLIDSLRPCPLEIEGSGPARLTHTVLIYGQEIATLHEFANGQIQPGRTLDLGSLTDIIARQGKTIEVLPPRAVAHGTDMVSWWRPAGPVAVIGEGLPKVPINLPAMLFKLEAGRLSVAALAKDAHPRSTDPVHFLPLPNVYEDHGVCWGSTPTPPGMDPVTWEEAFFLSKFNVLHLRRKFHKFPGKLADLYRAMTTQAFSPKWLVKTITVHDFINSPSA